MKTFGFAVASVLAAITLSGCGSDSTSPAPPAPNTTNVTTPAPPAPVLNTTTVSPTPGLNTTTASVLNTSTASPAPVLSSTTSAVDPTSRNVVEAVQANPNLTALFGYLNQSDLTSALQGEGPYTVFAPTNAAFALVQAAVDALTNSDLSDVLQYHVGDTLAAAANLTDGQQINTLFAPHVLTVDKHSGASVILVAETNNATVSVADVICSNGVVHIIDGVLLPDLSSTAFILA